jgi:hypothetical protein
MAAAGSWFAAFRKAVLYHWNLLFVGVAGGVAFLSGRPDVVLPLAGAAEIAYLAILSSNARFQNLAVALEDASGADGDSSPTGAAAAILPTLPHADRARYQRLSDLCTRLRRLSVGDAGHEPLGIPDLQLQNIDRLLRIYLRLLAGKTNLERFFATVDRDELRRDLARARERLAALDAGGEDPARTAKRRETVLDTVATIERRLDNYRLVQENHDSIVLELERLHTKIAGIAEMGIDRQDAASVGREIELVTSSVEGTERTMREIEDLAGVDFRAEDAPPAAGKRTARGGVRA